MLRATVVYYALLLVGIGMIVAFQLSWSAVIAMIVAWNTGTVDAMRHSGKRFENDRIANWLTEDLRGLK